MKKKADKQEQILDEIRQKVLEESENLKTEKEQLLQEKVTLEALQEMTDLPMDRIRQISTEVKNKHKKGGKVRTDKIISTVIVVSVLAVIGFCVTRGVLGGIKNRGEYLKEQAFREASEDYYRLKGAAGSGNLDLVKYHVQEENIPVELDGFEGDSALMSAVEETRSDIISYLLENGADVLKKNTKGRSIMDLADEETNIVVKKIISTALVNTTPADSPIRKLQAAGHFYSEKSFLARLAKKDTAALRLFLAADEGLYSHTYDDQGILIAAEKGFLDIMKLIYTEGKNINPEIKNVALLKASLEGHIDIIDFLLDLGADINYKYDLSHYAFRQAFTPLMCALAEENEAAEHLLKKGADPNLIGSSYDMLPLMIPIFYINDTILSRSRLDQLRLLLRYGADINKKDGNGLTSLEYAQSLRSSESRPISRVLIEAGAEIPMTEDFFRELVFMNDLVHVKEFLDFGMDPDLQGFEYYDEETTALIKSVMLEYYDLAKMLIEYGADVNYQTADYRKTPLLMALDKNNLRMVRLLLDNGAGVTGDVLKRLEKGYIQNSIISLIKAHH